MAVSNNKKGLFKEFPPVSTEQWEEVIEKDLKGADYDKRLIWRSVDGITVRPYFRREDIEDLDISDSKPGVFPFTRGTKTDSNNWLVRQVIKFESAKQSSDKALFMIEKGAESIWFSFKSQIPDEELKELLDKLPLKKIEIVLSGPGVEGIPGILDFLHTHKGYKKSDLRIHWDWDPLGEFILSGRLGDEDGIFNKMAELLELTKTYPGVRIIGVHGNYFRNAGSKFVQELGFSLAQANEYLAEMDDYDFAADETAAKVVFNFSVGSNYFLELAKLRAARLLWSRIVSSYPGVETDSAKMYIHAETSKWNKTIYDPYVNMLRNTTEAMSAVLGGIDSLTVHPFDSAFKTADDFGERLARNTQIILKEEAHFDKVVDPAGGSYYIEKLTDSIASEAWKLFQEVEKRGGFTEAFLAGFIQNEITTSAQMRDENIALRKEILLGVNYYPDSDETLHPDADQEIIKIPVADPSGADAHPLIPYRGAEVLEDLRMATGKMKKRPKVFLLPLGKLQWRKARADFAANFFGCAGYEIIGNNGFNTVDEGMEEAFRASADIIVLCSSDEEYEEFGPAAARINKGKAILVIAGNPSEAVEKLKAAGISHFIHLKTNILKSLSDFHKELGIKI